MDPSSASSQRRIDESNFIKYEPPLPSKVKYTPPSPTTSGYSESGSEMDAHDSGRVSEMENSPKIGPRRPNTISFGRSGFHTGETQTNSPDPFSEGKNTIRSNACVDQGRLLNKSASDDYAMPVDAYNESRRSMVKGHKGTGNVTVSAEALRTLVLSVQDARTRLALVEGKVDGLVRALKLHHENSNKSVVKLSKALVALGNDFNRHKRSEGPENGRVPTQFQPISEEEILRPMRGDSEVPFSNNNNNVNRAFTYSSARFQSVDCIDPSKSHASSTHPADGDYHTATYPRFLRGETPFSPLSVAPPNDSVDERYDNFAGQDAGEAQAATNGKSSIGDHSQALYVNNDVIKASSRTSFEDPGRGSPAPRPRSPLYAVVNKKKLAGQISSDDLTFPMENGIASHGDDVSEHTMRNEGEDDIEKIMSEMAEAAKKDSSTNASTAHHESVSSCAEEIWVLTTSGQITGSPQDGAASKNSTPRASKEGLHHADPDFKHINGHSRDASKCSNRSESPHEETRPDLDDRARYPEPPVAKNSRNWHELEQDMTVSSVPNIQRATVLQPCDKKPNLMRGKSVDSIRESASKSNSSIDTDSAYQKSKKNKKKSSSPKGSEDKKGNLFSGYNRWFKRKGKHKTKRSVSQNSFTFVQSPLYDGDGVVDGVSTGSPGSARRFKSVDSALSDHSERVSRVSQDITTISSLSNLSSSFEGSLDFRSTTNSVRTPSGEVRRGSSRSLATRSPANAQLYRLQSREDVFVEEDASSIGEFDNVSHLETLERKSRSRGFQSTPGNQEPEEMMQNVAKLAKKALSSTGALGKRADTPQEAIRPDVTENHIEKEMSGVREDSRSNPGTTEEVFDDDVFIPPGIILERQQHEQAERIRYESDHVRADEPPPKPNRPGMGRGVQGSPRSSVNAHGSSNGSVPGAGMYPRGMPAVPPKSKIMTPEELTNHEAQEKLRMKQMEEAMLQQRLDQQQKQAEENARWLQQEEQMLNPEKTSANGDDQGLARGRGSSNSLTDMQAPPPPSVAPSKPPRKSSRPKDEPSGPPQTKLEEVKTAPTMQLNREDDHVYKDTMEVVKAVLGMNQMTMDAKPEDLFASVKGVGAALKQLCTSLEEALPSLPEDFHREIDMAQKTTNKDLSQVINQLKLVQRFYTTTQVVDYKKCLMAANQVLAIDAKNLLDVVDRARIRKIQNAQEAEARLRNASFEPHDLYPTDVS